MFTTARRCLHGSGDDRGAYRCGCPPRVVHVICTSPTPGSQIDQRPEKKDQDECYGLQYY